MRLVYTLLIIVIVVSVIYVYRSDMHIDDYLIKGISQIRQQFNSAPGESGDATTTKIYKYRNADGEWVFTNKPPDEPSRDDNGGNVLEYRSDTNVLPAPTKEKNTADQPASQDKPK